MTDDLQVLMRKISRITFFFLFLGCLGWAVYPKWEEVFGGYLIGALGSLLFTWQLAWKIIRVADMAAGGRRSRGGFGFLSRAAIGLLAAVISVRTLGYDPAATVAGLITSPMATLVLGLSSIRRRSGGHPSDERGEKQ
ncbi:ATP synthase subunit I [Cohnella luojiensis]|uniref:ATP synthase subunit I n=1 Tax=Cohnella luojiensis TaxID=652876 RepID=A0A4Y8M7M9_9BACL|nr:ATP synthase subunit I [Cohnella luojiensis]TFE28960.1 ATP synthase subunit I [Cohnella luojiensis]